jgi:SM-20-related protein
LESNFETLIASFIENKVGISNQFLSNELADRLKINLLTLHKEKLLLGKVVIISSSQMSNLN